MTFPSLYILNQEHGAEHGGTWKIKQWPPVILGVGNGTDDDSLVCSFSDNTMRFFSRSVRLAEVGFPARAT